jgi:hypothetical protein
MHLPVPSPPMRGLLLRIVAWLASFDVLRDLILCKVKRDAKIPQLPG